MEEQTSDIDVTVKTLDSQSRTYTVGAQVNVPASFLALNPNFLVVTYACFHCSAADSERVQGAHSSICGHPCGQTKTDLPGQSAAG